MLKDFKEFAFQGNIIDLAVAVIFGTAFGAIVTSLVDDIIMPLVGILIGGIDFSGLAIEVGSATVMYGAFIQTVVNFLIIAMSIFLALRLVLRRKKEEEEEIEEEIEAQEQLLMEIRDLLKSQNK
ncbi:MAG TPA: large conductance mechanosensitive channel protein MscL [Pseudogracilibacillus sp.]|nr:large conductance mechanosensitive channel protein MscL [Pseudogracilibacillus sp.]